MLKTTPSVNFRHVFGYYICEEIFSHPPKRGKRVNKKNGPLNVMDSAERTYRQLVSDNIDLLRERCWYYSGTDQRLFAELLHEVFIDLWSAIDLFAPSFSPRQQRQWLRGRCRGVYKRHRRLLGPSLLPLSVDMPDDVSPELLRESIEELAEDLDDTERNLLDLLLQGYSNTESAQRLGLSRSAVTKRYRRMIEKMKQRYRKNLRL